MLESIPGDPDSVLVLADALQASAVRLGATADAVRGLGPGAVWDGPAGTAFGGQVSALAPLLAAAADRSAGSAAALRAFAPALDRAQATIARAVDQHLVAERRYAALEEEAYTLLTLGRTELDPEVIVVRQAQCGALAVQTDALATHRAAVADFEAADATCGAALRRASADAIGDSAAYRMVLGASSEGRAQDLISVPGLLLPPVGAAAGGVGAGADAMLAGFWDEGGWDKVAVNVALAGVGSWGKVLKAGALAGSTRTVTRGAQRTSTVTGASMTTRDRLRAGVRAEVDDFTDSLRGGSGKPFLKLSAGESARVTPEFVARQKVPWRVRAAALPDRAREWSRHVAATGREKTILGQWELASAGGTNAKQMYAAGVTLEVSATVTGKVTERVDEFRAEDRRR